MAFVLRWRIRGRNRQNNDDPEEALELVGGLSKPSKMPCPSYSLPAKDCLVGAALRKIPGSVCHGCYAFKGFYTMPNVKSALERRMESLLDPNWTDAMVIAIDDACSKGGYFRWHDGGDLQGEDISEDLRGSDGCRRSSSGCRRASRHREEGVALHGVSSNLIIRVSAAMIDGSTFRLQAHVHRRLEQGGSEAGPQVHGLPTLLG
jgi:hypothetical protein